MRTAYLWTALGLLRTGALVGALLIVHRLQEAWRPWTGPALVAVAVLGLLQTAVVPLWRYRVHRWEVTDRAVYTRTGWWQCTWRVAPMSRVQSVDTVRGPLQQMFGLATVRVATASREGGLTIAGLDAEVAAAAAERVTQSAQVARGDAT